MNPLPLILWLKDNWVLVAVTSLILMLTAIAGVQTYRLQGAQAERDQLALEKVERAKRDAMREATNLRNRERTDEEFAAARGRAALVVVRGNAARVDAGKPIDVAGGGDGAVACFDRGRLNAELAGWVERHAAGLSAVLTGTAQSGNERFTAIAREGEGVAADYRACRAWALNLVEGPPTVSLNLEPPGD